LGYVLILLMPPKRLPSPPYNPELRRVVEGKRAWSVPVKKQHIEQGFRGWYENGYLPHRDEPGLTQFVTFRLADSLPEELRSEWEALWRIEDNRKRRVELERYLDKGRGKCHAAGGHRRDGTGRVFVSARCPI
jgi:hypothetical protein